MNSDQDRAPVGSDFEVGRQLRETRNERVVHLILGGLFLASLLVQMVALTRPDFPVHPPPALMIVEGFVTLGCAGVVLALRLWPAYRPWRKYLLTVFDLAAFGAIGWAAREIGDPVFHLLMPVGAFLLVIVLCGLRYSIGPVALAGAAAVSFHVASTAGSDLEIRLPVLVSGVAFLAAGTVAVAFIVRSLIQLHRQSVSKDRLRRFFPPEVVDEIEGASGVSLGAVEREVTVIFADISGFTRMSSGMAPKDVVRLLNDYFPTMVEVVFSHGGTLEKYIGDALLAVWGAPVPWDDAADRAVAAAVDMQRAVGKLNRRWENEGRPTIQIHVGVHSGKVAAGHIGSDAYVQYACIGDTTNVSSRVCSCAEAGEVLISSAVRERLLRNEHTLAKQPPAKVKGKDLPLELYRVGWQ